MLRHAGVAGAHADVLDDHVVRGDVDAAADQRDARRRRGLAGDGQEGLVDLERLHAEVDDAADFEHDDARTLGLQRFAQRARRRSAASVVTRMIWPPRPPGVCAAQPTAPGKASVAAGACLRGELAAATCEQCDEARIGRRTATCRMCGGAAHCVAAPQVDRGRVIVQCRL